MASNDSPWAWRKSSYSSGRGDCVEAGSSLPWRKSSYSGQGNCVEVATNRPWQKSSRPSGQGACVEVAPGQAWQKSSHSASVDCVEVASQTGVVAVRDSKDPDGAPLILTPDTWRAFLAGVRAGQYR
jgi:Domain of unknown function (DUF397)